MAFGAKAALTSLQGTAERTVESYNEAKKNLNDSYRSDPARSITGDIHEYARARIANIQGAVQFATLPVGIATDTVTGLVGATTEGNDYFRQYRQNQETIAAMHSMDAATLFKSIGNLTERQQQNNREAADKAAFWRDFSQSLNQKAQQNPISASAMDIAARTVGLRFGAGAAAAGMGRTATEGMVRNGFGSFGSGSFAHAAEAMAAKRAAAETKAKVAAEAEALKRIGANQSARKAENAALSNRQPGEFAARQQAKRDRAAETAERTTSNAEFRQIFNSIKDAPKYPEGFRDVQNGLRKVKINRHDILDKLRGVENGEWKKVYRDGIDKQGNRVSIHYFQHTKTGKVFDVDVKKGWSN